MPNYLDHRAAEMPPITQRRYGALMNVEREDREVVVRLTPFELHVVHAALHQYGEHLLPEAVDSAPSTAAREALSRFEDVSTQLGRELDAVCFSFGHGNG